MIQLVIGNLISALPLALAIAYTIAYLDDKTREQRALVIKASEVSRSGFSVEDQIKDVERTARQFVVLGDDRIKQLLTQRMADFSQVVESLQRQLPASVNDRTTQQLLALTERIPVLLASGEEKQRTMGKLSALFEEANQLANQLNERIENWVDLQIERSEHEFEATQTNIFLMAFLVVPVTMLVVVLVAIRVSRPIRTMSEQIRRLGKGDWEDRISVPGPRDLSDLGERLEWLRAQLLELEHQKESFLRHVTHELKTPLASIKEAGALLMDQVPGKISHKQREVLTIQQQNVDHLQAMIEQLLSFNAIRSTEVEAPEAVDLLALMQHLKQHYLDWSVRKKLRWELSGEAIQCYTDRQRLEMALTNLISNGIKFSPDKGTLSVDWSTQDNNVLIAVTDDGPGIVEEEKDRIFAPFYQGRKKAKGALKGSGIGLAIVKECVESLGGVIIVENHQGRGARFTLSIPNAKPADSTAQNDRPMNDETS